MAQADSKAQASIIGGEPASITAFPSLAFIYAQHSKKEGFACTGTVISPRVILTAAHCVENLDAGGLTPAPEYTVATGVANPHEATPANLSHVSDTYVFPKFNPGTLISDAGILVLETPTPAPPIPLPGSADAALYDGGAPVLLAGWGLTDPHASSTPDVLQTTTAVVQPPASCKRKTRPYFPFYSPASQMCTSNPPKYATGGCFGDSGGPVIAHRADASPVEIGIVSTGGPDCSTKVPNIFTRTDRLAVWASEWIAAIEAGGPAPDLTGSKVALPPMSNEIGKSFVSLSLEGALGRRFDRARDIRGRCGHVEPESVKCTLAWSYGPNLYSSTVTAYYEAQRGAAVWGSHYRIRWVNRSCWLDGGNRKTCRIHTKRR